MCFTGFSVIPKSIFTVCISPTVCLADIPVCGVGSYSRGIVSTAAVVFYSLYLEHPLLVCTQPLSTPVYMYMLVLHSLWFVWLLQTTQQCIRYSPFTLLISLAIPQALIGLISTLLFQFLSCPHGNVTSVATQPEHSWSDIAGVW